jgi:hypothetical protein
MPSEVYGFAKASDRVASAQPAFNERVAAIATLLGSDNRTKAENATTTSMLPPEVGAVTFVVPRITVHRVYVVPPLDKTRKRAVDDLLDQLRLAELVKDPNVFYMGTLEFDGGSPNPYGTGSIAKLTSKLRDFVATTATVFEQQTAESAETPDVQKEQARVVVRDMQMEPVIVSLGGAPRTWSDPDTHHITIVSRSEEPQ